MRNVTSQVDIENINWSPHVFDDKKTTKSECWDYMGDLTYEKDGAAFRLIDKLKGPRLFCRLCLEEQKAATHGMLMKIYDMSHTSGTGNFYNHAGPQHNVKRKSETKSKALTNWFTRVKESTPATNDYELNRDLTLWLCRDLLPFSTIEKSGFINFNEKNLKLHIPSSRTLATTALLDIYQTLKEQVITKLKDVSAATLMMDGWTDKHKRNPYFAIRVACIQSNWQYEVYTLAIKPVESHTSENLSLFVREVLDEFFEVKPVFFDTTDGAANMLKLSKLLKHERVTCIAHSLHNLLVTDSIEKNPGLEHLLLQCKNIVNTLHFKAYIIQEVRLQQKEKDLMEALSEVYDELLDDDSTGTMALPFTHADSSCGLKNSVPTRWNSILSMVRSLESSISVINEVLKRIGKSHLVILDDQLDLLKKLCDFLTPFEEITVLLSEEFPGLSTVPLIQKKIKKLCIPIATDIEEIALLKNHVMAKVEKRIPTDGLVMEASLFDPCVVLLLAEKEEVMAKIKGLLQKWKQSRYVHIPFEYM